MLACNVSALEAEAKESSGPASARNSEVWAIPGYRDHLKKKTMTEGGCSRKNRQQGVERPEDWREPSGSRPVQSVWESCRSRKKGAGGRARPGSNLHHHGCHHPFSAPSARLVTPFSCPAPGRTPSLSTHIPPSPKSGLSLGKAPGSPRPSKGIRLRATQGSLDVLGWAKAKLLRTLGVC